MLAGHAAPGWRTAGSPVWGRGLLHPLVLSSLPGVPAGYPVATKATWDPLSPLPLIPCLPYPSRFDPCRYLS